MSDPPYSETTIQSAALTDTGRLRTENQDTYLIDDRLRLYAVADGMGGHRAGEVASALVVDALKRHMDAAGISDTLEPTPECLDAKLSKAANQLCAAVRFANRVVYDAALKDENCRGMGSTLAAVWFTPQTLIAANVGDSPIFLIHDGKIEPLSVMHTVEAEQEAQGSLDPAAIDHPFRHMLTRGMGVDPTVKADICEAQWFAGDYIVICSDGLTNKASPEEICEIVSAETAENACAQLVHLANARGGEDNVTVLVLHIVNTSHTGPKWLRLLPRSVRRWMWGS